MGRISGVAAIAIGALLLIGVPGAAAKTYRPNKTTDHAPNGCTKSDCTLREAVIAANAHAGSDKIVLRPGKVYKRSSAPTTLEDACADGDLDVNDALRIETPKFVRTKHGRRAAKRAVIDANHHERVIDAQEPLTLVRLVLRNGEEPADGGGISADDTLKIYSSQILNNHSVSYVGAVHFDSSTNAKQMLVSHTLVKGNSSEGQGGALYMDGPGKITDSVIANNHAPHSDSGGLHMHYNVEIVRTAVSGNTSATSGAGIFNDGGTLTLRDSTVSGNTVSGFDTAGAGIYVGDATNITNSTISGNRTDGDGAGIAIQSPHPVDLNNVTIVRNRADTDGDGNEGGGLSSTGGATPKISNTIIALNTVGGAGGGIDCYGTVNSLSGNLLGDLGGNCTDFSSPDDFLGGPFKLGPLKGNGGPTKTVALLKGSRAINHGSTDALAKDQRGRHKSGVRDIGAFEYIPPKHHKRH